MIITWFNLKELGVYKTIIIAMANLWGLKNTIKILDNNINQREMIRVKLFQGPCLEGVKELILNVLKKNIHNKISRETSI